MSKISKKRRELPKTTKPTLKSDVPTTATSTSQPDLKGNADTSQPVLKGNDDTSNAAVSATRYVK